MSVPHAPVCWGLLFYALFHIAAAVISQSVKNVGVALGESNCISNIVLMHCSCCVLFQQHAHGC